jgi:hypothetical protein
MEAIIRPKRKTPPSVSHSYPGAHNHVPALDKAGLLIRVERPINKYTEMHPLVWWHDRLSKRPPSRQRGNSPYVG